MRSKLFWRQYDCSKERNAGSFDQRDGHHHVIDTGTVDEYPPGSVTHIPNGRFYLSRLEDGGFLAIYQRCTHLGCNVPWDQVQGKFICPCHNSQFTAKGDVLNPPAPRPMDLFPITIEGNQILVDTGVTIGRDRIEESAAVYA